MDKQDLDLLLQARTSELQHEYENLVRSLDAAYESVKAIGRDIAENRAEARRLFDTRLKLARGDDLEAVLRLCSGSGSGSGGGGGGGGGGGSGDAKATSEVINKTAGTLKKQQHDDLQPAMVRLYRVQSDANTVTTPNRQHVETQQQRVVTVTTNEGLPRLRPIKSIQSFDAATLLIEQLRQPPTHQQEEQEPQYSPVYVGDDHSYAVNEEENEELTEQHLIIENGLMVQSTDLKRKKSHENHTTSVDLSIVKTEIPDNSTEEQNPLVENQQQPTVHPVSLAKNPNIVTKITKRTRIRKIGDGRKDDDEIVRKRKQTRERMRRWRAKKKMEVLNTNSKQPYKYKLVIAKTANS